MNDLKVINDQLERYVQRLEILRTIDTGILAARSSTEIAAAALRNVQLLVATERASVSLFDLAAGEVQILAMDGSDSRDIPTDTRAVMAAFDSVPGLMDALKAGRHSLIEFANVPNPSPIVKKRMEAGFESGLTVPIRSEEQLVGALALLRKDKTPFSEEDIQIAREIADLMAIALIQAQLKEEVALRKEVEQAKLEAEKANRAKSEFLSRMSHELRTPLNAVIGFAQLLELDETEPTAKENIGHILQAGRHLLELINEILDLTRIEQGRLSLSIEPVSVEQVMLETTDLIRPMAEQRSIEVEFAPGAGAGFVLADHQRLKQAVLNFLSNAVKYNREDGKVMITSESVTGGLVAIQVQDTGGGIPEKLLGLLFEPFERLGAEQAGVEGTGIGLALTKKLIEAMGGNVGVKSKVGEGCTFWITLQSAENPEHKAALDGASEHTGAPSPVRPRTILYVEDNLVNLKLVEKILERRPNVKLIPAMQGGIGVELAREHHPDLMLLDVHLPDIEGAEVLRRLRESPDTQNIPVVALSAEANRSKIERYLATGARAYLTKPLNIQQFLEVVDEILAETGSGG